MTGVGGDSRGRAQAGSWIVIGLLLSVAATVALVFTDDLRWLRLGIIAALWAAVIGSFLATRNRKRAQVSEQAAADAQAAYEMELELEVSARREHELEIEAEVHRRVDTQAREELESLRAEVAALRENLQSMMGGEVLYERVALTAERMRQLGEDPQMVPAAASRAAAEPASHAGPDAARQGKRLEKTTASTAGREHPTEVLDRVPTGVQAGVGGQPNRVAKESAARVPHRPPPASQAKPAAPPPAPAAARPRARAEQPARPAAVQGAPAAAPPKVAPAMQRPAAAREPESTGASAAANPTADSTANSTLPDSVLAIQQEGRQGGRRRKVGEESATDSQVPSAPEPQQVQEAQPTPEAPPAPEAPPTPETAEASGSHAKGRSVNDLLAAHGAASSAPHRRRRTQD